MKQGVRQRNLDSGDRCCWRIGDHDRLDDRMRDMWDVMPELVGRHRGQHAALVMLAGETGDDLRFGFEERAISSC